MGVRVEIGLVCYGWGRSWTLGLGLKKINRQFDFFEKSISQDRWNIKGVMGKSHTFTLRDNSTYICKIYDYIHKKSIIKICEFQSVKSVNFNL